MVSLCYLTLTSAHPGSTSRYIKYYINPTRVPPSITTTPLQLHLPIHCNTNRHKYSRVHHCNNTHHRINTTQTYQFHKATCSTPPAKMSGTTATVTVLYPAKEGATFNMDYYLSTHMPLVSKLWSSFGLKHYYITDLRHSEQPYTIQATLVWESAEGGLEGFKAAVAAHAPEVMGDIANFSSEQPTIVTGSVVASQ